MKQRFFAILLLVFMVITFFDPVALGRQNPVRQIIILDLPRLDLAEINNSYPNLVQILSRSATGLVTVPTAAPLVPAQVYLYFSSGTLLAIPEEGIGLYNASESVDGVNAGQLYRSLTGVTAPAGSAVCLDSQNLVGFNRIESLAKLGLIGQTLHQNSFQTAAIGNSDSSQPFRPGALLLMDQAGKLDYGAIGTETLRRDANFPYGVRTDPDQVIQYFRDYKDRADVILITLGDLERLAQYQDHLSETRLAFYRRLVLQRYDVLLGRLTNELNSNNSLLLIFSCLQPEQTNLKNTALTPIIIQGPGFKEGLLTSQNTRQKGLVTYADLRGLITSLATTDLNFKNTPLATVPGDWRKLAKERVALVQNYSIRWDLLTVYGVSLIGLFFLLVLGLVFAFNIRILIRLAWGYLFLLTFPATFLIEALINPLTWPQIIFWTLVIATSIFSLALIGARGNPLTALARISLITLVIVLVDSLFGGYAELKSFLGYSAVSGGRYYGIGNEYMGVMLGAYITWVALFLPKVRSWRRELLWLAVFLISLVFFHPYLGADIGGGISTLLGLGITTYLWLRRPIGLREIGRLLIGALVIVLIVGIWDSIFNQGPVSHLGQLWQAIRLYGFAPIAETVARKLAINWQLINYTPLSLVLIGLITAVPVIYKFPPPVVKRLAKAHPELSQGFVGLCITALIGLVLNDTGIAAAATMLMFGLILILLVFIQERTPVPARPITEEE